MVKNIPNGMYKKTFLEMIISDINYEELSSISKKLFFLFFDSFEVNQKYTINNNLVEGVKFKQIITPKTYLKLVYEQERAAISFLSANKGFLINNKKIDFDEKNFFSVNNIKQDSIVRIGDTLYDMADLNSVEIIFEKLYDSNIEILKPNASKLFSNVATSFNEGLWKDKVTDCSNKMEGQADIGMRKEKISDENMALRLSSKNHYACTSNSFPIKLSSNKIYKLQFDYKNIKGKDVRYYYRLRNSKNKDISYAFAETIKAEDNNWHTFSTIINPKKIAENLLKPEYTESEKGGGFNILEKQEREEQKRAIIKDVDLMDIYFYAPSDGTKEVVNLYDNVKLSEYTFDREEKIDLNVNIGDEITLTENTQLQDGENKFEYINDQTNLLGIEDNSFESDLWKKKVGDCSNSKPGTAKIGMEKIEDASEGHSSLKLFSSNHYACTNKSFPVKLSEGKTYKLIFDYKNIKGDAAMVYYNLRSQNDNESHSERIKIENHDWNTHEMIIDSNLSNIKNIDIYFYSPSDGEEVVNLYDNVRLVEWLPKDIDSYYLYAEQEVDETPSLESVEYKGINRWKNRVVLHGVNRSFLLAYPEKYSEKWKTYQMKISPEVNIDESKLNGYVVPEIESNRQATKDEVKEFINNGLISAVGKKFISKNFDGSIRNDNLKNGWWGETFFKPTIPEDTHYQINNYGNSWWVDLDQLCKADEKGKKCRKNDDGTYDIELIIENKLNRYLNGLLVFLSTTAVILLISLVFNFIKQRKIKTGKWKQV